MNWLNSSNYQQLFVYFEEDGYIRPSYIDLKALMDNVVILFKNKAKADIIVKEKAKFVGWQELSDFIKPLSKDLYYVEDKKLTRHLKKQGEAVATQLKKNKKGIAFDDIATSNWSSIGIDLSETTNKLKMREYQKNIVHQSFATWNWGRSGSFTLDTGMGKTFILHALAKSIVKASDGAHQVAILHGTPYVCKHHFDAYARDDPQASYYADTQELGEITYLTPGDVPDWSKVCTKDQNVTFLCDEVTQCFSSPAILRENIVKTKDKS